MEPSTVTPIGDAPGPGAEVPRLDSTIDALAAEARRPMDACSIDLLLGTEADKAGQLASELSGDLHADAVGDALVGDVVVLAIPHTAIDDVLGAYGQQLNGKVIVDITNPVDFSSFTPLDMEARSALAEISEKSRGARVVKAFNTTVAGTLVEGQVAG